MAVIDLVRWTPGRNETVFAFRYPETNLSTYTQLIVHESQEVILFAKGEFAGKFGPGKHTLNTENLPVLRSLYGLPFEKKNPFTEEIWFVNKLQPCNIDWVIDRMPFHDPDYNTNTPLVAKDRYELKIMDAERFLNHFLLSAASLGSQLLKIYDIGMDAKGKSVPLSFDKIRDFFFDILHGKIEIQLMGGKFDRSQITGRFN